MITNESNTTSCSDSQDRTTRARGSMAYRLTALATAGVLAVCVLAVSLAQGDAPSVNLGESAEHGSFLTDAEGFALYLFTPDEQGPSTCAGDCAVNWPPYVVTAGAAATAGEGVDAELLGTVERADGTVQVTYNDWPLYYYIADTEPGQVNGHLVGGNWFLVNAEGEGIGMTP